MNRRHALCSIAAGSVLGTAPRLAATGLPALKITDVKTIPSVTHRERPLAVASAISDYLKPFVLGKNPEDIEDIWQSAYVSSHFRSGVILNNALSGIDGAL
jgi:L-alanine-DL-glutamate epimerase-like enolase superfamily enzyme